MEDEKMWLLPAPANERRQRHEGVMNETVVVAPLLLASLGLHLSRPDAVLEQPETDASEPVHHFAQRRQVEPHWVDQ